MKFSDDSVSTALLARNAIREYPFPSLDGVTVGVRMLHGSEVAKIRDDAVRYCKEHRVDLVMDPDFFDLVVSRMTLLAAFTDLEDQKPFFASLEQVFRLDVPLATTLYGLYLVHCQTFDPYSYATQEDVEALVAQLGKSGFAPGRLSLFGLDTLRSLCLSMARLLHEMSQPPR